MVAALVRSSQEPWRTVLALHPWERVLDVGADVERAALLGRSTSSLCLRVEGEACVERVLSGASQTLDHIEHWAVLMAAPDVRPDVLAHWAATRPTYLFDRRTGRPVRMPGGLVDLAAYMLASGWLHTLDCLVTSPAMAAAIATAT
jgi:hypothetical protein